VLFILVLACGREPYYAETSPDTHSPETTQDTDTDTDTGPDTTQRVDVWDDPAWWLEPGPFAPLLDLSNAPPGPHWEAWVSTSPDLKSWTKGAPFAYGFSSLDLLVVEQGIIVGGSLTPDEKLGIMAPFEHYFALHTQDLKTWGSHQFYIENAAELMIIDPSIHETPDGGLQLVYYASSLDVDPEKLPDDYPNPHAIYMAPWDGEKFVQTDSEPLLQADYVVDPTGCYHDDQHYMLGTRRYGALYFSSRAAGDPSAEFQPVSKHQKWGGVQVPYCFTQGDEPLFIAQYGGGYGPPQTLRLDERGDMTPAEALLDLKQVGYDGCTSPVLGYFDETYFLICVSWIE